MILSNFDRIYSTIWKHLVASLCRGQEAFGKTAEEVKAIKSLRATGHRSCGGKCRKPALRRTHGFRYLEKVEKDMHHMFECRDGISPGVYGRLSPPALCMPRHSLQRSRRPKGDILKCSHLGFGL